MSAGETESWARLRLVQGASSAQVWELVSSAGQTTLTVGSSPNCNWVVREDGVEPVHFSLHWDGSTLRVADIYAAGNVRLDNATVGPQWKAITGRSRLEFGKAAIVVEASAGTDSEAPHPLEPAQPTAQHSGFGGAAAGKINMKATLIGVSPLTGGAGAPVIQAAQVSPSSQPPSAEQPPSGDSFRPPRSTDSQRPHKPTLMGIPGVSTAPSSPAPAPAGQRSIPSGTLMDFGMGDRKPLSSPAEANVGSVVMAPMSGARRVGGASLADGDQRTIQGFPDAAAIQSSGSSAPPPAAGPGRRVTRHGVVSDAPAFDEGAVAQSAMRAVSAAPAGSSGWQEAGQTEYDSEPADGSARELAGVALGQSRSDSGAPAGSARTAQAAGVRSPRPSDGARSGRDAAPSESSGSGMPMHWAYLGIAALTAVAYFAWLYLLDHL